jgi:PKD repeat protein
MKFKIVVSFLFLGFLSLAQTSTKKVLFLGNSYTSVNNLPQMIKDVALSVNDTVVFDVNAPGGYTFQGHSTNTVSLNKIMAGIWDYVVLQEQSQMPSFPDQQVATDVFPYARALDSVITQYNICSETIFYMTWGRKNGDASNCSFWPPVCTYNGMDSLLNLRYQMMAEQNTAIVSPVGEVWNYVRTNHPEIELYSSDESHPSVAGTYLAACTFYSTIFRKDPTLINFFSTLSTVDAIKIQNAVKLKVYDSLMNWNIGLYDLNADFSYSPVSSNEFSFTNNSTAQYALLWDFGDGNTSIDINPIHQYSQPGVYEVVLTINNCGKTDSISKTITVDALNISENQQDSWKVYPNPVSHILQVDYFASDVSNFLIYNGLGEIVLNGNLTFGTNKISTDQLNQGVYYIEFNHSSFACGRVKFIKMSSNF